MKKNTVFIFSALVLGLSLLVGSCSKDTEEPAVCDSTDISYSATIAPIISKSCFNGCHNGSAPTGGFRLDSYAGVKAKVDDGRLYGAVARQSGFSPMPQGASKLPDCQLTQIKSWIDAGATDN